MQVNPDQVVNGQTGEDIMSSTGGSNFSINPTPVSPSVDTAGGADPTQNNPNLTQQAANTNQKPTPPNANKSTPIVSQTAANATLAMVAGQINQVPPPAPNLQNVKQIIASAISQQNPSQSLNPSTFAGLAKMAKAYGNSTQGAGGLDDDDMAIDPKLQQALQLAFTPTANA
jgi:hypothetical protein